MHIPVLQKEVLEYLNPKSNENFIDATIGGGGHALAILEKILPRGKVLGIDWDSEMIQYLKPSGNLILVCDNFVNLKEIVKKKNFGKVSGILFDLGMSSWHLGKSGRGFSFQKKEPLDMRYSLETQLTAEKIVNYWSKFDIEKILREYGEEKFARIIAENIIETRKARIIKNTFQLVEIIKKSVKNRQKIHPATRTFQALRIAVNDELNNLKEVLSQALETLSTGGRLIVISFHSLEDRIVKNFFKHRASKGSEGKEEDRVLFANQSLKILTKKPITPSNKEIKINPRSRSAKLRAAQKGR